MKVQKLAHEIRPPTCPICLATFETRHGLKTHMKAKRHHIFLPDDDEVARRRAQTFHQAMVAERKAQKLGADE